MNIVTLVQLSLRVTRPVVPSIVYEKMWFITVGLIFFGSILNAQPKCESVLDTITVLNQHSHKTGIIKDTIVKYKKLTIDTIFFDDLKMDYDTIFFVRYYDKGWRHINDTLYVTDHRLIKQGYLHRGLKCGMWIYDISPECFSHGLVENKKRYFYDGIELPGQINNKYYFLRDTICGWAKVSIQGLESRIDYCCAKSRIDSIFCNIYLDEAELLTGVQLDKLFSEIILISEGAYGRVSNRKGMGIKQNSSSEKNY